MQDPLDPGETAVTRPIMWALGAVVTAGVAATVAGDRLAARSAAREVAPAPPPAISAAPPPKAPPVTTVSSFDGLSRIETIQGDARGHFAVGGRVDGTRIDLVVDTGASLVVLREEDAERVGIHLRRADFTGRSNTANGTGTFAPVTLRSLRIGEIEIRDVQAAVVPRGQLGTNLLGMSFLRRLRSFDIAGNRITLKS